MVLVFGRCWIGIGIGIGIGIEIEIIWENRKSSCNDFGRTARRRIILNECEMIGRKSLYC